MFGISWNLTGLTPGRDRVALGDTKHIEAVVPVIQRTKKNPRKWVMKKYESQVGELDQKLELKTDVLHGDRVGEIHMPLSVGFVAEKKEVG